MRITGVRTTLYEYGVRRPIGDVQLPDGARRIAELAVFLTTDEDVTGVAIGAAAAQPIVHALAEQLVGRDPREVRGLYELMQRLTFKAGPDGVIGKAVAALDTALWDLRAKQRRGAAVAGTRRELRSGRRLRERPGHAPLGCGPADLLPGHGRAIRDHGRKAQGGSGSRSRPGTNGRDARRDHRGIRDDAAEPDDRRQRVLDAQAGDPADLGDRTPIRPRVGGGAGPPRRSPRAGARVEGHPGRRGDGREPDLDQPVRAPAASRGGGRRPGLGPVNRDHDRPADRRDERRAWGCRSRSSTARAGTPPTSRQCCRTT